MFYYEAFDDHVFVWSDGWPEGPKVRLSWPTFEKFRDKLEFAGVPLKAFDEDVIYSLKD